MSKVAVIALSQIRPNPAALRSVDKGTEKYVQLVDSIKTQGVINAISVRELDNPGNPGETLYGLIDGLHRYTASVDAGLINIPATIASMNDAEVEEAQIVANFHKIDTKPVEYSKALHRMMARNPTLTQSELSGRLSVGPAWLADRLSLVRLIPQAGSLVDEGKITLCNAYALAKLPADEQPNFLDRAMTQQPSEFVPAVNSRVKEVRDAMRQGREPNQGFTPTAHLRKLALIREEIQSQRASDVLTVGLNPAAAFVMALNWVLHLDPISVREATEEHESRKKAAEQAKAARAAERAEKKANEALAAIAS